MNFKKSRIEHSDADLVEAFVFLVALSADQQEQAARQLQLARARVQSEMSTHDRLIAALLQAKLKLEEEAD